MAGTALLPRPLHSGGLEHEAVPRADSSSSRDELIARYGRLVKYVVGRLRVSVPGLFDHEDAMQAGTLGLLRAVDAYRPDAGTAFESYAIIRIRGAILDAVRSLDNVSRVDRKAARDIQAAASDLHNELGRTPTEPEIAARLGITPAAYRKHLQAASVVVLSLDEGAGWDDEDEPIMQAHDTPDPNAVDPAEEAVRRDSIASLARKVERLSKRTQMVLALYYQDEMTYREIGLVMGVSQSRVCQIHTQAILVLRDHLVGQDVAARRRRPRART